MICINCERDLSECVCKHPFAKLEELYREITLLSLEKRTYISEIADLRKEIKELRETIELVEEKIKE